MVSLESQHLPQCPIDPERYNRLYAFNHGLDDQMQDCAEWREIRIKAGRSEEEVYRLLPSAADFEHSGYLTRSRIRYRQGGPSSAGMLLAKPCTFHSHPTRNRCLADIPSLQDVYSFLNYRHLRTITVGATKLWVWDKTKATLGTVRRLASWKEANHFRVATHLMKKDFDAWQAAYLRTVMKYMGWKWPKTFDELDAEWPRLLPEVFKIRVRVIPRQAEVSSR